jgi:thymidylate synthase ThyX
MNADYFQFSLSNADDTGLVLVSVTDTRTGYTVRTALPHSGTQTASIMAFAGARFSRSALTAQELFQEIQQAGSNANEKLANIFRNYGHSSVADMAQIFAYIEQIPDHYSTIFFNESSVGGGQQRSTRYQDYSTVHPVTLASLGVSSDEEQYEEVNQALQDMQHYAIDKYSQWQATLRSEYTRIYGVDTSNSQEMAALTARVFDTVRYFLPSGLMNKTSLAYITSAREWARLISVFKASPEYSLICLGEQLEVLFAPDPEYAESIGYIPEAPDLIRHTQADTITHTTLAELRAYITTATKLEEYIEYHQEVNYYDLNVELLPYSVSAGQKVLFQCLLTLYPSAKIDSMLSGISQLTEEQQKDISGILFKQFTHHKQMGNAFRVNTHSFILTCSNSEIRDLNRHRAWGRYIPIIATQQYEAIVYSGYTLPLYLTENRELSDIRDQFEQDIQGYYLKLQKFIDMTKHHTWFPQYLWVQILPFAHIFRGIFHASPKELSYMTQLRVRPGGHINYRFLAYEIARLAGESEPLLSALQFDEINKPNPSSRQEFVDRS